MPYIDGKRVSNEEWTERFGSIQRLHTGPDGDNPASAPDINEEVGAPVSEKKTRKPGNRRSKNSAAKAKAAIADALGVKEDSSTLDDIDVSGLDAEVGDDAD